MENSLGKKERKDGSDRTNSIIMTERKDLYSTVTRTRWSNLVQSCEENLLTLGIINHRINIHNKVTLCINFNNMFTMRRQAKLVCFNHR